MFNTGKVSFISEVDGGYSANGDKIGPTIIKTAFVTCNMQKKTQSIYRTENVQDIARTMTILVDYSVSPTLDFLNIKSVELIDSTDKNIGVFPIQEVALMGLVKRIKLEV